MATVLVDDAVRYGNCELRTRYYDCPAGTFFGLETLGVAEEQAIIEDGTNRKMFTLDRMDSAGLMYGDGVILVDRTGPAANVYVDGLIRFANCTLRPV